MVKIQPLALICTECIDTALFVRYVCLLASKNHLPNVSIVIDSSEIGLRRVYVHKKKTNKISEESIKSH